VELKGAVLPTQWRSSTELNAQISAARVAHAGRLSVVVKNPGVQPKSSNTQTLSVVSTPVIASLEPASVVAGSAAFTLTVSGSGFVSGATVNLGRTALPTQFQRATELTAQVTTAQVMPVGQLSITVSNPGGATSNSQTLTVAAAPDITSVEPSSVTAGTWPFALAVRGNGFASPSVVELNGTALASTFVNSTELDAYVPRSGYITGADGTFVLFLHDVAGRGQTVTLIVSHPSFPDRKLVNVNVQRGATVLVDIAMS
jgi:hypothetical protein